MRAFRVDALQRFAVRTAPSDRGAHLQIFFCPPFLKQPARPLPLDDFPLHPKEDPTTPPGNLKDFQNEHAGLELYELGEVGGELEGPGEAQDEVQQNRKMVHRRREEHSSGEGICG